MDLASTRAVAVLSSLVACSSLLTVVSLAFILTHWHDALDACIHADCGCLLYAGVTSSTYVITGSDVSICWFSGAAPLPGLLVALSFAACYGYRGFIRTPSHLRRQRTFQVVRAADGSGAHFLLHHGQQGQQSSRSPPPASPPQESPVNENAMHVTFLVMQGVGCLMLSLFSLSHVAVLTDGFLVSCREYRRAVLKTLKASGSLALLVNERLSCTVIFDFLDYMKPDVREVNQDHHWMPGQRRLTTVSTAAALVISLIAAYACVVLWFALAVKFGVLAQRASRQSRDLSRVRRASTARARSRTGTNVQPLHGVHSTAL